VDEALLRLLVQAGIVPEEQALAMTQYRTGESLYGTPSAQGMNVGGTYVAASPLEHLSVAAQRGLGAKQQQRAVEDYRGALGRQTSAGSALGDALKRLLEQQLGGAQVEPQVQGPAGWGYGY
jgi:hypothetical protein